MYVCVHVYLYMYVYIHTHVYSPTGRPCTAATRTHRGGLIWSTVHINTYHNTYQYIITM